MSRRSFAAAAALCAAVCLLGACQARMLAASDGADDVVQEGAAQAGRALKGIDYPKYTDIDVDIGSWQMLQPRCPRYLCVFHNVNITEFDTIDKTQAKLVGDPNVDFLGFWSQCACQCATSLADHGKPCYLYSAYFNSNECFLVHDPNIKYDIVYDSMTYFDPGTLCFPDNARLGISVKPLVVEVAKTPTRG